MEEVDKIIIESLRNLNCEIDEEIDSLKQFTPDLVVAAVSTCLESSNPQTQLPKKLPPSMSARIKFASNLAQQIKDFGFKGDMGYQTILYCNEVEVRRVLMFLLEHLPKETASVDAVEPIGYVPKIVKQIENSLKESLGQLWLPSEVCGGFGYSRPIDSVNLIIPKTNMSIEESALIPPVNLQCTSTQLLPSILFEATKFSNLKQQIEPTMDKAIFDNNIIIDEITGQSASTSIDNKENKIELLLDDLKQKKEAVIGLQIVVNQTQENLLKLKQQRENEQRLLEQATIKVKLKNKTMAVLSSEDNKLKLKNLIQKGENRLVDLVNQWSEVQGALLQELDTIKNSVSTESLKHQQEQNRLYNLKQTYKDMVADFKDKSVLEQQLIVKCKELNSKNNRAAYTKRILEIVANIRKQKKEIEKILLDTRRVQKDINGLTGQVDRSFTLSDELIFYDCKHDETSRKAYKLLAALREECNNILQAVMDLGQAERELRNLEEQLETEKNKDVRDKLDKVQRDLAEMQKEIEVFM